MKIEDSGSQAAKGDIVDTSSSQNRHQTCGQLKSKTTKDFNRELIGDYVRAAIIKSTTSREHQCWTT
jgi:hypothetical protein